MPSEEVPEATTDRALAPTAVAVRPAWDLEVEVGGVEVEAVVGEGRRTRLREATLQGAQNEISLCEWKSQWTCLACQRCGVGMFLHIAGGLCAISRTEENSS